MIITSGKKFDFRFFIESQAIKGNIDDSEEHLTEEIIETEEQYEEDNQKLVERLKEELPGLLGTGHVGIKDQIGSYRLFGSFKKREEKTQNTDVDELEQDFMFAGMLSYLFFIAEKLVHEDRKLELDLIQLQYENGYLLLKPLRNIAIMFDTTKSFEHVFIEENLPPVKEFDLFLQNIKDKSNKLIETYENVGNWLENGVKSF